MENTKTGVELIAEERQKQIDKHGFTAQYHVEHPEYYETDQLQRASFTLLTFHLDKTPAHRIPHPINWDRDWFIKLCRRSKTKRLIIAGALIAAELDRLNAIEKQNNPSPLDVLQSINEKLSVFLSDEDLTDEKLRDASESLLPNIQSECAKILLQNT